MTHAEYHYTLPEELIGKRPTRPRDAARLLIHDRASGTVSFDTFRNIGKYLPPQSVLVLNDTKVIPARIAVTKPTGGKVELLYVETRGKYIFVLSPRVLEPGMVLTFGIDQKFAVAKKWSTGYLLKPSFPIGNIFSILDKYGVTPLPPYLKNSPLTERERRNEYQTVFARSKGSVAAPTASLHFTDRLFKSLKKQGITVVRVTLRVGLGTFAPLTAEQLESGKLHKEWFEVTKEAARVLNKAKKAGRPIVAVGTTALRTLESAASSPGVVRATRRETDLFIRPGYQFKFVDALVTNFHVPDSSLLMLVAALTGKEKLFKLYDRAIQEKFRFFSFGDGMLVV